MKTYKTSEVAAIIGIHPNTVRIYEEWGLIPKPYREENGYRVFIDFHIQQIQLAHTAFQIEILRNGLRKQIVQMVKLLNCQRLEILMGRSPLQWFGIRKFPVWMKKRSFVAVFLKNAGNQKKTNANHSGKCQRILGAKQV